MVGYLVNFPRRIYSLVFRDIALNKIRWYNYFVVDWLSFDLILVCIGLLGYLEALPISQIQRCLRRIVCIYRSLVVVMFVYLRSPDECCALGSAMDKRRHRWYIDDLLEQRQCWRRELNFQRIDLPGVGEDNRLT